MANGSEIQDHVATEDNTEPQNPVNLAASQWSSNQTLNHYAKPNNTTLEQQAVLPQLKITDQFSTIAVPDGSQDRQSREGSDGSTRLANGAIVTRKAGRDGQADRITSATTASGESIRFSYSRGSDQPQAVTIGNNTYALARAGVQTIRLDQTSGEVQISGLSLKDDRPWTLTQQLSGTSIEVTDFGTTTTTRGPRQETATRVNNDGQVTMVRQTTLDPANRSITSWTQTDSEWITDANGRQIQNLLHSRYDAQGRMETIPGLNREQVNTLRAQNGQPPLGENDPVSYQALIRQRSESPAGDNPLAGGREIFYQTVSGARFSVYAVPGRSIIARSPLDTNPDK